MHLRSLEIENFQSLVQVKLEGLNQFNVLIGRNNAGKSAVFGTLSFLNSVINGQPPGEEVRKLTHQDATRRLEIRLLFALNDADRKEFVQLWVRAGGRREMELLSGSFLRQIHFAFRSPPGRPELLHLRETKLWTEDKVWAVVQKMNDAQELDGNPSSRMLNLASTGQSAPNSILNHNFLDVHSSSFPIDIRLSPNSLRQDFTHPLTSWLQRKLSRYLENGFFFQPFRHSTARLPVQQAEKLTQDGSNLAQVLHTINSNDRKKFMEIEEFAQAALPDVGQLQPPIKGKETEVCFRSPRGNYLIRLHEMGGGIEQLLMAATVLLTTDETCSLFLEEPESHLHPGAQRFLIERLLATGRQVFITTHSPIFVNAGRLRSLFQVCYTQGQTSIRKVSDPEALSGTLEDIGARNSDVLLSDAVLFVEGPSDRDALQAWSHTLGKSLEEHNISVLPMGGGEHAERSAPIRNQVLTDISQKAPIPCLFLLDRDERGDAEIAALHKSLGDRLRIFRGRELENYLLKPGAVLKALQEKCKDHPSIEKIKKTSTSELEAMFRKTAEGLYGLVLLKRVRAEIGGLPGGLVSRELVQQLTPSAGDAQFAKLVETGIQDQFKQRVAALNVQQLVSDQKRLLDDEWADPNRQLEIAPGEEILKAVFAEFGESYVKPKDTQRIAKEMDETEISPEITELITRSVRLASEPKSLGAAP